MSCTTILVGRKASYDGSTMIARTDDGFFDVKKTIVVLPKDQKKTYKSKIGHLEIPLEEEAMRYTASPSVSPEHGIWAAGGINEANVGMTATETISVNPRVLGADPYVIYQKKAGKKPEVLGGLGEEDFVSLVLPYIKSARDGVKRLGKLLETYGTYESNGIAFNDEKEIWWLETIGGHHWMAKRVKDEEYVIMPNRQGIDSFDFADAYGKQRNYMCDKDLLDFTNRNHLNLNQGKTFNPRYAYGTSRRHADHIYNNPRAWYIGRYFNPVSVKWEGANADYTPADDNIPWSFVPDFKITVDDMKTILSSCYEGTVYNPYQKANYPEKGTVRPIGINRTGVTMILQIRPYVPEPLKGIAWITYGSNAFNTVCPIYTNAAKIPLYHSDVSLTPSTENFYWASRIIECLADSCYGKAIQHIERYQLITLAKCHALIQSYDAKMTETGDDSLCDEANEKIAAMIREETGNVLRVLIQAASENMKNGFSRADN